MTQNSSKKTAIIAGGGVAGLYSAVLLDELGYAVTLYEKKPILGGRTYSFKDKITGSEIDNGQHLLCGAYHETLTFLEKIGAKSRLKWLVPTMVPLIDDKNKKQKFFLGTLPAPFNAIRALLGFGGLGILDKLKLVRLAVELANRECDKNLGTLSAVQWLKNLGQSERAILNFWQPLILATLNDSGDNTTADGLWQVLKKSYFAGARDGYLIMPKVGLTELFANPAENYLNLRGQNIVKNLGVREIRIMDNKAQGFVLDDDTLVRADLYVSALPHAAITKKLPHSFVDNHLELKNLKAALTSPIISVNLFFDRPVLDDLFIGGVTTTAHWFFDKGPTSSAHGHHHIVAVMSAAYDLLDKDKRYIIDLALTDLNKIAPKLAYAKLTHALVNKERQATLSCRTGVNLFRPHQKLLDNLYIVGDWTRTGLPPTIESASMSARLLYNSLLH